MIALKLFAHKTAIMFYTRYYVALVWLADCDTLLSRKQLEIINIKPTFLLT